VKLTITIPLEGQEQIEDEQLKAFAKESKRAVGLNVEVGRFIPNSLAARVIRVYANRFEVKLEK